MQKCLRALWQIFKLNSISNGDQVFVKVVIVEYFIALRLK